MDETVGKMKVKVMNLSWRAMKMVGHSAVFLKLGLRLELFRFMGYLICMR
jgi:hypothetical protein